MSDTSPSSEQLDFVERQFRELLAEIRQLYALAAAEAWQQSPDQCGPPEAWCSRMDSLHFGLVLKVFFAVSETDVRWTIDKHRLTQSLILTIWNTHLDGDELREAVLKLNHEALRLTWSATIGPFERFVCLREHVPRLETLVMRLANVVVKSDGHVSHSEAARLVSLQEEFCRCLVPLALDIHDDEDAAAASLTLTTAVSQQPRENGGLVEPATVASTTKPSREEELQAAVADLESLIGLGKVKQEVLTLTNFLRMQQRRKEAGLPQTTISLHLVFSGNPGTGKTTVARIVARIYAAMGLLKKGHLVETDRSGLVARFAGQTAPQANKKIDEALDGVLFIDEAYNLTTAGDDSFGHEAIGALVKRLEDDRHRLVVILAGYDEPMETLMRSNAGLSSRFSTRLMFDDYTPGELGRIFGAMCRSNHYVAPGPVQARLLAALTWLHSQRDEHFGNGRLVRNLFERAIRHLANRIASVAPLTDELLTVLYPEDLPFSDVPGAVLLPPAIDAMRFELPCPQCQSQRRLSAKHLGRRVQCKKCGGEFAADWPDVVESAQG